MCILRRLPAEVLRNGVQLDRLPLNDRGRGIAGGRECRTGENRRVEPIEQKGVEDTQNDIHSDCQVPQYGLMVVVSEVRVINDGDMCPSVAAQEVDHNRSASERV